MPTGFMSLASSINAYLCRGFWISLYPLNAHSEGCLTTPARTMFTLLNEAPVILCDDWKMGLGNPVALPHLTTNTVTDDWIFYLTRVNSTRRFLARPSSVSLLAAGFVIPKPVIVSRLASTPLLMKYSMAALARLSESFIL